jgi:hypothetical protein
VKKGTAAAVGKLKKALDEQKVEASGSSGPVIPMRRS